MPRGGNELVDWLLYALFGIAILVTIVWSIVTIIAAIVPSHPVQPDVNLVMGGTVTAAFGLVGVIVNRRDRNGKDS